METLREFKFWVINVRPHILFIGAFPISRLAGGYARKVGGGGKEKKGKKKKKKKKKKEKEELNGWSLTISWFLVIIRQVVADVSELLTCSQQRQLR